MSGRDFHTHLAKERFTVTLKVRKQELKEVICMLKGLTKPFLRCQAIEQLHLIQRITALTKDLTAMEEVECNIQIEDDAKSFA